MNSYYENCQLVLDSIENPENITIEKLSIESIFLKIKEGLTILTFSNGKTLTILSKEFNKYLELISSNSIQFSITENENNLSLIGFCNAKVNISQGAVATENLKKEIEKEKKNQVFLRLYGNR